MAAELAWLPLPAPRYNSSAGSSSGKHAQVYYSLWLSAGRHALHQQLHEQMSCVRIMQMVLLLEGSYANLHVPALLLRTQGTAWLSTKQAYAYTHLLPGSAHLCVGSHQRSLGNVRCCQHELLDVPALCQGSHTWCGVQTKQQARAIHTCTAQSTTSAALCCLIYS